MKVCAPSWAPLCALRGLFCSLGRPSGALGCHLAASSRPLGGPRRPQGSHEASTGAHFGDFWRSRGGAFEMKNESWFHDKFQTTPTAGPEAPRVHSGSILGALGDALGRFGVNFGCTWCPFGAHGSQFSFFVFPCSSLAFLCLSVL